MTNKVVKAVKKSVTKKPEVVEKVEKEVALCGPCNGTGLADKDNLCVICEGSGKA